MTEYKSTICVDFDGVIHSYTSGWQGASRITDPPVPGAFKFLHDCLSAFDEVYIFSTRCRGTRGRAAIKNWIKNNSAMLWYSDISGRGLECLEYSNTKVAALVYVDDRGFRFEGEFPSANYLRSLMPWWKK